MLVVEHEMAMFVENPVMLPYTAHMLSDALRSILEYRGGETTILIWQAHNILMGAPNIPDILAYARAHIAN